MTEIIPVKKLRKKRVDRPIPEFRLTQCMLERIEKIIAGYSKYRASVKFDELAFEINEPKPIVSLTSSFLSDMGILEGKGASLKYLTAIGRRLGNAITFENELDRIKIWREIIMGNDYCIRFIQSIDPSDKVSRKDFRLKIMHIAGYFDPIHEKQVGTNALIDLFAQIGYVSKDGSKTNGYYSISDKFKEDLQKRQSDSYDEDTKTFISNDYIAELKDIRRKVFDVTRLIKYCQEVNDNYARGNYFSFLFVSRAILDHCPLIFGYPNFDSLCEQLPARNSLKSVASKLNTSLKKIADHHIHKQIGSKETLPAEQEIDFRSEMNFLIRCIIERLSKEKSND